MALYYATDTVLPSMVLVVPNLELFHAGFTLVASVIEGGSGTSVDLVVTAKTFHYVQILLTTIG